jgi:pyridinium-3,5-biscarboxylic acid mononucleotide sulfurtransferase
MIENKTIKLDSILNNINSFAVAFSGGVDSSFLLHRAHKVKKTGIIAITIRTPYMPFREIDEAIAFTKKFGIKHKILDIEFPEIIRNNPIQRCYLCKKKLFTELLNFSRENNYEYIVDGTNFDDIGDFRPGMKALKEMSIRSPLIEAGLTKKDIRDLLRKEGLAIWDKPAMACLLTRIPYDTEIKESTIRMIEIAENMLFERGYPGTRVRIHGEAARIECLPEYIEKIFQNPGRDELIIEMKKIGFRYVSLDLEGYRKGKSNPEKNKL